MTPLTSLQLGVGKPCQRFGRRIRLRQDDAVELLKTIGEAGRFDVIEIFTESLSVHILECLEFLWTETHWGNGLMGVRLNKTVL